MMQFRPKGWKLAIGFLVVSIVPAVIWPPTLVVGVVVAVGTLLFFRDPERTPPSTGIVSPADGRVSVMTTDGDRVRVGVFMNVTDVHVNRSPIDGEVVDITHRSGAHRPAFSKDSDRNERVRFTVETALGTMAVDLIAGAFARRITPLVGTGDTVDRGERIGYIAFGSRVDVTFPPEVARTDIIVAPGDRVRAGETPIVPIDAIEDKRNV